MNLLLLLPVLIPFGTAIACLMAWARPGMQRWISLAGSAGLLVSTLALLGAVYRHGYLVTSIGNWQAPFGITFVADLFSAVMVAVNGLMGVGISVYSLGSIDRPREHVGYHALVQFLLMGVSGAFLTGDLFNLYVWFEVMLMASFVLMALGGERPQLEGSIKYVTLNLISSAVFLAAAGLLYGSVGTLNMADAGRAVRAAGPLPVHDVLALFFLVAFGIKAGMFPLFFWLPASYHTPPTPVSALFAGLLTKVGVYALVRVFTVVFVYEGSFVQTLLPTLAGLTMVVGVLGAAAQQEMRRVLSFHIVSQIGYMLLGLALMTPLAVAGTVFYIVHHIIVKTNLFLVAGVVLRLHGTLALERLGGMVRSAPVLAALFLIPALSLAGVPPLSGFWAKYLVVRAGIETSAYIVTAAALAVGLLTLYSMIKIWIEVFWKARPKQAAESLPLSTMERIVLLGPIAGFALITLTLGLWAQPLLHYSQMAALQLLDPLGYIEAVLGALR